ncbi:hypothetical protein HZH68_003263 [Vespula germanica]|uniref:Uncharacterized protein n=1 Tax=Vespula germanica TaxID=30212 RepID=A0A834NNY0_VESGE|nr:hypothetical protein HZH68_003263 [Vespula germanica]
MVEQQQQLVTSLTESPPLKDSLRSSRCRRNGRRDPSSISSNLILFRKVGKVPLVEYDKKDHQEREDGLECHIESRESRILGSKVPLHILSSSFSLTALHFDECNSMREFETSNNVEKAKSRDEEEGSGRMMGTLLLDPLY